MGPLIDIKLDQRKYRRIQSLLKSVPRDLPKILSRALNRTIKPAKTEVSKGLRKEINIKAAEVKKGTKVNKASTARLITSIILSHKKIPIVKFGAKQTKKGVTFKVYKKKGRKTMEGAFLATMSSGHKGVFRRGIGQNRRQINQIRSTRKSEKSSQVTKHNIYIGEQFGTSLHKAFAKSEQLIKNIIAKAYQRLDHNIEAQIKYVFSRRKGLTA